MADMSKVKINYFEGFCPVQSEGTIDGVPYYFKARGNRWRLAISATQDPAGSNPEWYYEEPYGDEKHAAGWMTIEEAKSFFEKAVGLFQSGHPTKTQTS